MIYTKILLTFTLMLMLSHFANAQACGYTYLRVYLKDADGQLIKNAEIKTFDVNFKKQTFLHYHKKDDHDDPAKYISWNETEKSYFGREGMCGGHRNVGLKISAKGFETFNKIIDLPLGWTGFLIKLKRQGTNQTPTVEKVPHISGQILDENKAVVSDANLVFTDNNKKRYEGKSNINGYFNIDLPNETYVIQISKSGFSSLSIVNFQIENKNEYISDLTLKTRSCNNCDDSGNDLE